LSSPSYSFNSSRPSRNLSAWFSCRHTSPAALNELFNLSCWSIRHGNPVLIDELIDFLTTDKSGALLISELRCHGSRRHHQLPRCGDSGESRWLCSWNTILASSRWQIGRDSRSKQRLLTSLIRWRWNRGANRSVSPS